MVEALERAMAQARRLAPDAQDELAHLMMLYLGEGDRPLSDLTPEQEAACTARARRPAGARSPATTTCRPYGPSMTLEASLHPPSCSRCRSPPGSYRGAVASRRLAREGAAEGHRAIPHAIPNSGQPTRLTWLRRFAVRPYPHIAFYEATAAEIILHSVWHAARNPSDRPG